MERRGANLAPPADFGARLFSSLKADISSDETGKGRRRRAYTEMDDLLADDIKQGEQESGEVVHNFNQRSNPISDRGSKRHIEQLSEMGGDSKGQVSVQMNPFVDIMGQEMPAPGGLALKKRNSKIDDKQATSIQ